MGLFRGNEWLSRFERGSRPFRQILNGCGDAEDEGDGDEEFMDAEEPETSPNAVTNEGEETNVTFDDAKLEDIRR